MIMSRLLISALPITMATHKTKKAGVPVFDLILPEALSHPLIFLGTQHHREVQHCVLDALGDLGFIPFTVLIPIREVWRNN